MTDRNYYYGGRPDYYSNSYSYGNAYFPHHHYHDQYNAPPTMNIQSINISKAIIIPLTTDTTTNTTITIITIVLPAETAINHWQTDKGYPFILR